VIKNQKEILKKLGIEKLNPMQNEAFKLIQDNNELILLSPTGSGKTVAFLLPLMLGLDPKLRKVQLLIVVPSRELAIQIGQVIRDMGAGYKSNIFYGGRALSKDMDELVHAPAIIVGTPGRVADHLRRESFETDKVQTLVLDEYDKSMEVGFDKEMSEIMSLLPSLSKKILTSATEEDQLPKFIGLERPVILDYLSEHNTRLQIKSIVSPDKDKLETLAQALHHIGNKPGIVFCNFKNAIARVSEFLTEKKIPHGCFHGGIEQQDRERALVQFRNGSFNLLVATDLAARGLDISELSFILHYHLPTRSHEFTHRNGRTARMQAEGTAYVLHWDGEPLPEFIGQIEEEILKPNKTNFNAFFTTLFISGGRRDKISKGDIAGFLFKQVGLDKKEVGIIELKQECSFVAIKKSKISMTIKKMNNKHLKKRKVRVYEI
jgi:superfamily II DNA/RNA helicase